MRATEDQRVHVGFLQGCEVFARDLEQLAATCHARLDKLHESRAGLARDLKVWGCGEGIVVGARGDGRSRADDADTPRACRAYRAAYGGMDDLDHRDVVALASIAQDRRAGGIARDDEHLDVRGDEMVHDVEGVRADLGDRQRSVGAARRVTDVEDRLVRELVEDRPGDREAPDAGVKDPDGPVVAHAQTVPSRRSSASSIVPS